ncbi:MAG: NAD-dependent epimerase [Deltaproteobacteria bacterium]|nr:NAD-dependent epimerase [Deltaproteobacteria bacterium]MBW1920480.1 NAD-dependent epimerase [Deltaproteobacteria bacterium]MBW1935774.1 NAD-dependent epimerase [Deltaproteobacteria bacterium]MBW1976573.1 NAD-dependent epimerase [Deltaproteobacteria bacterium]MBW2044953.1 NAD-dependent epimerase [Deltaproteobacteria bacterium]
MKVLVTGTAGFIGSVVAVKLAQRGDEIVGIDSINEYYDVNLKYGRLERDGIDRNNAASGKWVESKEYPSYRFIRVNVEDGSKLEKLFAVEKFDMVCHLAAQAGVRYSLANPHSYIRANVTGFLNILECCRHHPVRHLVFASSSSVYGLNEKYPFSPRDNVDHPVSLYGASKKSNELMAHAYSHLFGIPATGLRYFTVYGPWGRPDMALFLFTRAILDGKPIDVYNNGRMKRDFTYIDDIVEGTIRVLDRPPQGHPNWNGRNPDPSRSRSPYRIYNIGNNAPVGLMEFIAAIEKALGKVAKKNFLPMQPGDVPATWADVEELVEDFGYAPAVSIEQGVEKFIKWYKQFYENHP